MPVNKESNRRSAKPRAENQIQKAAEKLRKAKSKSPRARATRVRDEESLMAQHAKNVREATESCAVAIIETGRRLIRAKAEISHGGWMTFIDKHLKWEHSSVAAFMKIGRAFGDQSSDLVRTLPGDQRTLVDLARVPAAGLGQLVKRYGGSLASVPRAALREDIRKLLPARAANPKRNKAPKSTSALRVVPAVSNAKDVDDAFEDPVFVAGFLLKLVSENKLTEEQRTSLLNPDQRSPGDRARRTGDHRCGP